MTARALTRAGVSVRIVGWGAPWAGVRNMTAVLSIVRERA
jgi:hypothetical protein